MHPALSHAPQVENPCVSEVSSEPHPPSDSFCACASEESPMRRALTKVSIQYRHVTDPGEYLRRNAEEGFEPSSPVVPNCQLWCCQGRA